MQTIDRKDIKTIAKIESLGTWEEERFLYLTNMKVLMFGLGMVKHTKFIKIAKNALIKEQRRKYHE